MVNYQITIAKEILRVFKEISLFAFSLLFGIWCLIIGYYFPCILELAYR